MLKGRGGCRKAGHLVAGNWRELWGSCQPGQGCFSPTATTNRNGKGLIFVFVSLWSQHGNNPPGPVFLCSQKNVNLFKQNPNFLAKEKKKKARTKKRKAGQTVNLWQTPAILQFNNRGACAVEALRPAAGSALRWDATPPHP